MAVMRPADVVEMAHGYMPSFLRQREKANALDVWARGKQHEHPSELYMPDEVERSTGSEYLDLAGRAPAPWLPLIVTSLLQTIHLQGVRREGVDGNLRSWTTWQENRFDAKQIQLYRSVFDHGLAFVEAWPGQTRFSSERTAIWRPLSARKMAAFFREHGEEYPEVTIEAEPYEAKDAYGNIEHGWQVQVLDEQAKHYLSCKSDGLELKEWTYISYDEHNLGFVPVIQYDFQTDLDGRTMGQIEPFIPLARRIDQDTFDRLIVQRFGAWKVRYIAGLMRPEGMDDATYRAELARLRVGDFLVGESADTKFGTLEETQLAGFIAAGDSDLRTLSATSQTPPHHMLGLSSNMQAESLAAAEGGLQRKSIMTKTGFGERHEQLFRTSAWIRGDRQEANAFDMQVRWRDMELRSLSQAADAFGKLATQVGVPQEMLFEMIPNWTDQDVARAKQLVESGAVDRLIAELEAQANVRQPQVAAR